MKNVLVTGGAGYIGSHACKALVKAGYMPIAYDNLVYGNEWAVQWGPLEKGDIRDKARIREVLEEYKPDSVMHFAAYSYVGESVQDPKKYYDNNVGGTLSLLEAMLDYDIRNIVFSSTAATYGAPKKIPMKEDHPQHPVNPYGMTKFVIEKMLQDFGEAYDLRYAILRYFNAAGADPDSEIGEHHDPETHLIPRIIMSALGVGEILEIYGTDYETKDGTAIRDYIHVSDLADAHVSALDFLLHNNENISCNLGTGAGYSVKEVVQAVEKVSNKKIVTKNCPRRPGDPEVLVADTQLATEKLKWYPKHSELESIIKTAWDWHSKL